MVDDPLVPVVAAEVKLVAAVVAFTSITPRRARAGTRRTCRRRGRRDRLLLAALVEPVRQGVGRGRLVDDPQTRWKPRDLTCGLLGGGALGVVEVRRNGDHRVGDLLAEVRLGVPLELHEHPRGDLLRGVLLALDVDCPARAHLALHRADGPVWVGHRLPLSHLADEHLAVLGERDDRRRGAGSLGVFDDPGLAALQHAHHGVCRAKVDADRTCHVLFLHVCVCESA